MMMKSKNYETLHDEQSAELRTKNEIQDSFSYTGIQLHKCPICEYTACHKSALKRHINSIHKP